MMTWTNILKKTFSLCLIGGLTCFIYAEESWALNYSECRDPSFCAKHNLTKEHCTAASSNDCSIQHCASGFGDGKAAISRVRAKDAQNCLSQMPIQDVSTLNISAVVGVRTDTKALHPERGCKCAGTKSKCGSGCKSAKYSDGTRSHNGVDVGTGGVAGVKIYAPAQAFKIEHNAPRTAAGCSGDNYMTLYHKRSKLDSNKKTINKQKNCDFYYTTFYHIVNPQFSSGVKDIGKGSWIADAGPCTGYPIHMHYEIHDCDGTLYNPTCISDGAGNPQQLCNGTDNVLPPTSGDDPGYNPGSNNSAPKSEPVNPHLSKMKDCCEYASAECKKSVQSTSKQQSAASGNNSSCSMSMGMLGNGRTGTPKPVQLRPAIASCFQTAAKNAGISPIDLAAICNAENGGYGGSYTYSGKAGVCGVTKWGWNGNYGCQEASEAERNACDNDNCRCKNIDCAAKIIKDKLNKYKTMDKVAVAYLGGDEKMDGVNKCVKNGGSWETCLDNVKIPANKGEVNPTATVYLKTFQTMKAALQSANNCSGSESGVADNTNSCSICKNKTEKQIQCEKRNEAIKSGGKYCPPEDTSKKQDKNSSQTCTLTKWKDNKGRIGSVPKEMQDILSRVSKETGVPMLILAGMVAQESGFNAKAKASDGGQGAIQFQPSTWAAYTTTGESEVYEPSCQTRKSVEDCHPNGGKHTGDRSKDQYVTVKGNGKCSGSVFNAYDNIKCGAILYLDSLKTYGNQNCAIMAHNGGAKKGSTCDNSSYVKLIKNHMNNLAELNNCSLDAVGGGSDNCEDFSIPAGDHYGSTGDSAYSYADNHDRFQSGYECNINDNYNSIKGCLFCNLFYTIYNTASKVAKTAHTTLADSFVRLLAVGLAISLAMMIMQYVSSMTQKDPMLLLNMIIRKMFVVMILIVLLKLDVAEFFNMFVTPIFKTGFKLAELAIANSDIKLPTDQSWAFDNKGLPPEMGLSMLRAIYAVQSRLEQLMAVGSNSICIAFYVKSWHGWPIFPHFGYLLTGLFLWLIAIVFMVCYPFLLIDCVLQFTIASALLPAAIAATAFEITKRYLNIFKVINTFFDAMFVFIFLTIVMFILLAGMDGAIIDGIKKAYETDGTGTFSLAELGWFTVSFLKLVFFLFLGKAVLEDIPSFASDFAKGLSMGESGNFLPQGKGSIGRSVGGTAAKAATETGKKAAGLAWNNAVKPAARGARSAYRGVKSGVKGAFHQNRVNRVRQQASLLAAGAAAGTSTANGEAWVSGRTWYGRKIQQRVVKDANGNDILETKRRSLFRNRVVTTQSDGNITITKKKYKNGKVKETYKMDSLLKHSLLKRDGTINKETLAALQQNSGLSQDMLDKTILNELLKKRIRGASLESGFVKEVINRYKDKNGNEVFEIIRTDKKGNKTVSRMIKGGDRFRVEQEKTTKDGKYKKKSSDGVVQKTESGQYETNDDGTLKTDANIIVNDKVIKNGSISADGTVKDKNGKIMGAVTSTGAIVDKKGNIIGHADTPDLAFDNNGNALGKINAKGEIVNELGNVVARVNRNGDIIDVLNSGKIETRVTKEDEVIINGEFINNTKRDGNSILDKDGNKIGNIRDDGTVISETGENIGTFKEKAVDVYRDVAVMDDGKEYTASQSKDGIKIIDTSHGNVDCPHIGYADENGNVHRVLGKANVSGLAFGNDGNTLGKITLGGTIVDADGKEVGHVGSHGTILDELGHQIGSISEDSMGQTLSASRTRSEVKFSHAGAYAGAGVRIFDIDGNLNDDYADEGIVLDWEDAHLYARQVNRHGDPKRDYTFR